MRVSRFDAGELAKPERTAEGFLRVEGVLARTCILHYLNIDGSARHELVTPECLFDPASMRSLSVFALTNNHPSELLTPQTVGTHQIGSIGEPRRDGDRLVSLLGVLRDDAIRAVEGGKAALSCGYSCEIDETPGEHPTLTCPECGTSHYDGVQRDRRGNHVAICDEGRAGPQARIRLDASGNAAPPLALDTAGNVSSPTQTNATESAPMPTMIRLDAVQVSSDAADLQAVIDRHLATVKADAAAATLTERERADAAVTLANTTKAKLDAAIVNVSKYKGRIKTAFDGMKARMMGCDECAGSGKVMNDAAEGACEYCGGTGKVRMHDAVKAMPMAPAEDALPMPPDDDMGEMEDAIGADPMMEAKPAEVKKDAAATAARKVAIQKRAESIARRDARNAKSRAALIVTATPHIDAADLSKSDVEIKRSVLVKVAAHLDAAKMDAADVARFYDAEMKRLDGNGAAPSLALTDGVFPTQPSKTDAAARAKADETAYFAANPWARPAGYTNGHSA